MSAAPDIEFERGLPASLDAERTILGAILLDNAAFAETSARLRVEDFALTAHQRVFRRMGDIVNRGRQCDIVTLAEELAKRKEIESVGGVSWLASLTEGLPRRLSVGEYVDIVRDKSLLRQTINLFSDGITRAADQSEDAESIISSAQRQIEALAASRAEVGPQRASEYLAAEYPTAESMIEHPARRRGIPIGIEDFDTMTCGLQPAELTVIAARPSMGKSDWADNLACHASVNLGRTVALYSPEMAKYSVLTRIICQRGRIDRQAFRFGRLTSEDRRYFADARTEVEAAELYLSDVTDLTLAKIRSETMHLKARCGLDLLIVDYLQLMSATDMPKKYNREQEVAGISRGLKLLAKDLEVPVVVMAQLSRDNTKRTDKRPILSDLRESGAIEQDADMVAFLHREEYYAASQQEKDEVHGKAEIIIAKQRNGPVGTVHCAYDAAIGRWGDTKMLQEQTEFDTGSLW